MINNNNNNNNNDTDTIIVHKYLNTMISISFN